jgi:hypothetical protein
VLPTHPNYDKSQFPTLEWDCTPDCCSNNLDNIHYYIKSREDHVYWAENPERSPGVPISKEMEDRDRKYIPELKRKYERRCEYHINDVCMPRFVEGLGMSPTMASESWDSGGYGPVPIAEIFDTAPFVVKDCLPTKRRCELDIDRYHRLLRRNLPLYIFPATSIEHYHNIMKKIPTARVAMRAGHVSANTRAASKVAQQTGSTVAVTPSSSNVCSRPQLTIIIPSQRDNQSGPSHKRQHSEMEDSQPQETIGMPSDEVSSLADRLAQAYPSTPSPGLDATQLSGLKMDVETLEGTWTWLTNFPDVTEYSRKDQRFLIVQRMIFCKNAETRCAKLVKKLMTLDSIPSGLDPILIDEMFCLTERTEVFIGGVREYILEWIKKTETGVNLREWIAENDTAGFFKNVADKRPRREQSPREGGSERRSESLHRAAVESAGSKSRQGSPHPSASGSQGNRSPNPSRAAREGTQRPPSNSSQRERSLTPSNARESRH